MILRSTDYSCTITRYFEGNSFGDTIQQLNYNVSPLDIFWEINDVDYGVNYTETDIETETSTVAYDMYNNQVNENGLDEGGEFILKYTLSITDQECRLEYWIKICLPPYGFNSEGNAFADLIGQEYEGGYVFYYENDYDIDSIKLLIVDLEDMSGGDTYDMSTTSSYDASETSKELFSGYANTEYLVDYGAESNSAQNRCLNHSTNDGQIKGWYLPSKDELNRLWRRMTSTSGPSIKNISDDGFELMEQGDWYWSSSLYSDDEAWQYDEWLPLNWDEEDYD